MNSSTLRHYIRAVLTESSSSNRDPSHMRLRESWKIRSRMPVDVNREDFEKIGRDFLERAKLNLNVVGPVEMFLNNGSSVIVDLSDPNVVIIDDTATTLSKVLLIKVREPLTNKDIEIPLTTFKKEGQFTKQRTGKSQLKTAKSYLAEWAVAYVVSNPPDASDEALRSYYDDNVVNDSRLTNRISSFSEEQKEAAFSNFVEMVRKSYKPFSDAGIPVGSAKDVQPDDSVTALVDVKFKFDNTDYTLHVKFNNRTRIAGIRKEENVEVPLVEPDADTTTALATALAHISEKQPPRLDTIIKPGKEREDFYDSFTPEILDPIADKIRSIIFGQRNQVKSIFNAIIDYTTANEPEITILVKPDPEIDKRIDNTRFTIERNDKGTTRFFRVDADVDGAQIDDVMVIELRKDKRVPQLHMSAGWDDFVSAIGAP